METLKRLFGSIVAVITAIMVGGTVIVVAGTGLSAMILAGIPAWVFAVIFLAAALVALITGHPRVATTLGIIGGLILLPILISLLFGVIGWVWGKMGILRVLIIAGGLLLIVHRAINSR